MEEREWRCRGGGEIIDGFKRDWLCNLLKEIAGAMAAAATRETAHSEWRDGWEPGSLYGHCYCVAWALRIIFGWEIWCGHDGESWAHYWARTPDGWHVELAEDGVVFATEEEVKEEWARIREAWQKRPARRVRKFLIRLDGQLKERLGLGLYKLGEYLRYLRAGVKEVENIEGDGGILPLLREGGCCGGGR